jgi:hypothetical protein
VEAETCNQFYINTVNLPDWLDIKTIVATVVATVIAAILIGLWSRLTRRPRLSAEIKQMRPAVAPESSREFRCEVAVKNVGERAAIVEKIIGFGLTYDGERKKLSHKVQSPAL